MKKILLALCLAVLLGLMPAVLKDAAYADTQQSEQQIPGPAFSKDTVYVFVGRTSTQKATPSTGVTWSISDPTIATVNARGTVKGLKAGECLLTAKLPSGGESQCRVVVRTPATKVTVSKASVTLNVGKTHQITPRVYPANATSPAVKYVSSAPAVASVDENGLVTALKKGTATITVTAPGGVKTQVKVSVRVAPSSVKLSADTAVVSKGKTKTLKATVYPSSAYNKTVSWKSSDTSIATVSASGVVTGKKTGQCVITATTVNGLEASCTVTVKIPVSKVTVSPAKAYIYMGNSGKQLSATLAPSGATDKTVTWKSSNTGVATVDENGFVTPVSVGTAKVTATSANGKTAVCTVYVRTKPDGVTLNDDAVYVNKGKTKKLTATVTPSNAHDKSVSWTSSDSSIATVSSSGVITGKNAGECTITATTCNGLTASCTVYVRIGVASVKLNPASATINRGSGKQFTAVISPSNATNKTVTWKSSNTKVATVDENGYVTAVGKGTATITATSSSNKKVGSAKVTVRIAPESVTLNKTSFTLYKGKSLTLKATVLPDNAYSRAVTWKSSDTRVATVNAYGTVTAVNAGECDITATAAGGKVVATGHVTVKIAVTGVSLNKSSVTLVKGGDGCTLTATVKPSNATDKTVTWESSNAGVASVDENGTVTAHSAGSATITVTTSNGKTASCKIKVVEPASSISLSQTSLSLTCGKNSTLKATVGPESAGDKSVKWTSSDKNVAAVTSDGKVFAKAAGTCVITATANGGVDLYAECQVTVTGTPTRFVALTYDGGPNTGYTTSILSTLDMYGVKATFFMVGSNVNKNPSLALKVYQAGHEIGNHSYTHPRLTDLSPSAAKAELAKTDQAVYKAIGAYPTVIRPPYGAVNRTVANLDNRAFVNWNVVSHDATYSDAQKIANITLSSTGYHNHVVILCHDTNQPMVQATKTIVPTLLSRGYTFVTVSEMMEICGYEPGDSVVFVPALQ